MTFVTKSRFIKLPPPVEPAVPVVGTVEIGRVIGGFGAVGPMASVDALVPKGFKLTAVTEVASREVTVRLLLEPDTTRTEAGRQHLDIQLQPLTEGRYTIVFVDGEGRSRGSLQHDVVSPF